MSERASDNGRRRAKAVARARQSQTEPDIETCPTGYKKKEREIGRECKKDTPSRGEVQGNLGRYLGGNGTCSLRLA